MTTTNNNIPDSEAYVKRDMAKNPALQALSHGEKNAYILIATAMHGPSNQSHQLTALDRHYLLQKNTQHAIGVDQAFKLYEFGKTLTKFSDQEAQQRAIEFAKQNPFNKPYPLYSDADEITNQAIARQQVLENTLNRNNGTTTESVIAPPHTEKTR